MECSSCFFTVALFVAQSGEYREAGDLVFTLFRLGAESVSVILVLFTGRAAVLVLPDITGIGLGTEFGSAVLGLLTGIAAKYDSVLHCTGTGIAAHSCGMSVCEGCVSSYCSCSADSPVSNGFLRSQNGVLVDLRQLNTCEVHFRCSFCNRPMSEGAHQHERSVKRKFCRLYADNPRPDVEILQEDVEEQVRRLMEALESERQAVNTLSMELEQERNAAAVAATETLAMIRRLQEEKASVQMEASQYKRMVEERAQYDQEAIEMLNEILARQEEENTALSKEIEMYRSSLADKERARESPKDEDFHTGTRICQDMENTLGIDSGDFHGRNLMNSFEEARQKAPKSAQKKTHSSPNSKVYGGTRMEIDEDPAECSGVAFDRRMRDTNDTRRAYEGQADYASSVSRNPRRVYEDDDADEEEHVSNNPRQAYWEPDEERYGSKVSKNFRRDYDRAGRSDGLYSSAVGRDEEHDDEERMHRAKVSKNSRRVYAKPDGLYRSMEEDEYRMVVRRNGSSELSVLSRRLQALEADREFVTQSLRGNGELEILQEISHQLRHFQAKDDVKELSEASFAFSFKGFFSFNGLRQSLHSNLSRLACMFIKHTDGGDHHHVGLSHLLENSRKAPARVTRGIKVDAPPLLTNSLYRQNVNVHWTSDARNRSETAFSGWDY